MCTSAETVFTTTSMTAVSVSMRSTQLAESAPELIQRSTSTFSAWRLMQEADEDHPGQDGGDAEQRRRQIHRPGRAVVVAMVAVIVVAVTVIVMGVAVMLAIDIGVGAQALEDLGAEQPGDQRAEQRQEDDGLIHDCRQPFIRLMSSTAMEPRLRK